MKGGRHIYFARLSLHVYNHFIIEFLRFFVIMRVFDSCTIPPIVQFVISTFNEYHLPGCMYNRASVH